MGKDKFARLTLLKRRENDFPSGADAAGTKKKFKLETFDNQYADRDYVVEFDCSEYTSLCPVTGQPDFGHIIIRYVPDKECIESKSLKLFLFNFRNADTFHEEAVNKILDAVVSACKPRAAEVVGKFRPRGGIAINVKAVFGDKIN